MLKIYDTKDSIPESLLEHYVQRTTDNKWEPKVEGINSIGGLIAKRDELLEKVKEIPVLKQKVADIESLEVLSSNHVAVSKDKAAQLADYEALGTLADIKPKLERHDEIVAKDADRERTETLRSVARRNGFTNEDGFISLAKIDNLETVTKTVKENGKEVERDYAKSKDVSGKEVEMSLTDYVASSSTFKPFADALKSTVTSEGGGKKVITQRVEQPSDKQTLETEKERLLATGNYSL